MREPVPLAEALDEAAADRDRGVERHLLGGDRGDEVLERVGQERRSVAREALDERRENGIPFGPGRKGGEIEGRAEEVSHLPRDRVVCGLDRHATRRGLYPHLAPGGDAVQATVVPEERGIGPEDAEALGGENEVVGLGKGDGTIRPPRVLAPPASVENSARSTGPD